MPLLEKKRNLAKIKDKIKTSRISHRLYIKIIIRKAIISPIIANLLK